MYTNQHPIPKASRRQWEHKESMPKKTEEYLKYIKQKRADRDQQQQLSKARTHAPTRDRTNRETTPN